MSALASSASEWLLQNNWAFMALACALASAAAVCAAAMPRTRSRGRAMVVGGACATCLAFATLVVWSRWSDIGRWSIARMAEPTSQRFSESSFEWARWHGPAAREAWLRQAIARGDRSGRPVHLPDRVLGSWTTGDFPRSVQEGERSAMLCYAEQAARGAMHAAVENGKAQSWFAVQRAKPAGQQPAQITVSGPWMQIRNSYNGQDGLAPAIADIDYGVIVRSVEWRDASGRWHPLLEHPVAKGISQWANSEGSILVSKPDVPAIEVRCSGDFVIASTFTMAHRTIPFEWHGPVR